MRPCSAGPVTGLRAAPCSWRPSYWWERCVAPLWRPSRLPVVLLALLALSGIGSGVVGPLMMSVAYQRVPQEVRGRVFGLLVACALAATPLGMLGAGVLLDRWGLTWSLVATGAVYLGVTLAPLVLRVWRQLDIPDPAMPQWDQAGGRAEGAVQVPVPASSH